MTRIIPAMLLALMLGACASHRGPGSIAGGECRIFEPPKYAVKGKTQYDQDWVDSTVEGGVGGCHWKRPAARPASLDVPLRTKAPPPPVKAKRSLLNRAKDSAKAAVSKVWPDKPVTPVEGAPSSPEPPALVVVAPPPAPPPVPRSRLDQLLHPDHF